MQLLRQPDPGSKSDGSRFIQARVLRIGAAARCNIRRSRRRHTCCLASTVVDQAGITRSSTCVRACTRCRIRRRKQHGSNSGHTGDLASTVDQAGITRSTCSTGDQACAGSHLWRNGRAKRDAGTEVSIRTCDLASARIIHDRRRILWLPAISASTRKHLGWTVWILSLSAGAWSHLWRRSKRKAAG